MDPDDFLAPMQSSRPAHRTLAAEELLFAPMQSSRPAPLMTQEERRARAVEDAEMFADLWDLPANAWSGYFGENAVFGTMEPTIEYLRQIAEAEPPRQGEPPRARYNEALRQIAELRRQGKPPRAVMQEPEQERGVGALFRRMLGLD
jgi:hypothetical protein